MLPISFSSNTLPLSSLLLFFLYCNQVQLFYDNSFYFKSSFIQSDRPIVRVSGTVMTRDDALGGWVPYLNGGQSKVGIHESVDGRQYRIYGWRVNDQKVRDKSFTEYGS